MSMPSHSHVDWLDPRKRRRPFFSRRCLVIVLILFVCLSLIPVLTPVEVWIAALFRAEDPLAPSDAVIVLLGRSYDRSELAAKLYRRGVAPLVAMCPTAKNSDELDVHRKILMRNGVPENAIRILPGEVVKSTYDEAERVRDYARAHAIRRITLVTTSFHTARTRRTFRRALQGLGVDVRVAASQDMRFTESDWLTSSDGAKIYALEALKTVYYWVRY